MYERELRIHQADPKLEIDIKALNATLKHEPLALPIEQVPAGSLVSAKTRGGYEVLENYTVEKKKDLDGHFVLSKDDRQGIIFYPVRPGTEVLLSGIPTINDLSSKGREIIKNLAITKQPLPYTKREERMEYLVEETKEYRREVGTLLTLPSVHERLHHLDKGMDGPSTD